MPKSKVNSFYENDNLRDNLLIYNSVTSIQKNSYSYNRKVLHSNLYGILIYPQKSMLRVKVSIDDTSDEKIGKLIKDISNKFYYSRKQKNTL